MFLPLSLYLFLLFIFLSLIGAYKLCAVALETCLAQSHFEDAEAGIWEGGSGFLILPEYLIQNLYLEP